MVADRYRPHAKRSSRGGDRGGNKHTVADEVSTCCGKHDRNAQLRCLQEPDSESYLFGSENRLTTYRSVQTVALLIGDRPIVPEYSRLKKPALRSRKHYSRVHVNLADRC